jgi:hypothetical protein
VVGRVAFDNKGDLLGAAWQWKVWTASEYVPLERFRQSIRVRLAPPS